MPMEEFRGYVSQIIYRNKENGYTVFEVVSDEETMTCTGYPAVIGEGESCRQGYCKEPYRTVCEAT